MPNFYAPFERQYTYPGEWTVDFADLMLQMNDPTGAAALDLFQSTVSRNELNDMTASLKGMGATLYDE